MNLDTLVADAGLMTNGRSYRDVILGAYQLIEDPERWLQGTFARGVDGHDVTPVDPRACRRCVLGAVACSSNELGFIPPPLMRFLDQMLVHLYKDQFASVGEMNDYVSHSLVLEYLRACLDRFDS